MSTVGTHAEPRVVLPNVSWSTYLGLLADVAQHGGGRLAYDRGVLEIMTPSLEHENCKTLIGRMIEAFTEELGIDILSGGSTTLLRDDVRRGIEPDECYYVQHAASVRNKTEIELSVDPVPDLAVEIDVTQSSLDKLSIYAALGIPEVWRYDGQSTQIYVLGNSQQYSTSARSTVLPEFPVEEMNRRLQAARTTPETDLIRSFRRHVRQQAKRREGG
jgi:Uma2 family endonuclease